MGWRFVGNPEAFAVDKATNGMQSREIVRRGKSRSRSWREHVPVESRSLHQRQHMPAGGREKTADCTGCVFWG